MNVLMNIKKSGRKITEIENLNLTAIPIIFLKIGLLPEQQCFFERESCGFDFLHGFGLFSSTVKYYCTAFFTISAVEMNHI